MNLVTCLLSFACFVTTTSSAPVLSNTVAFIEPNFVNDTSILARIATVVAEQGGSSFQRLSMMAWGDFDFAPTPSNPLPQPDTNTTAFLLHMRSIAPSGSGFKVWGGINLCPGRAFECMLNYSNSDFVGKSLGELASAAGLDGVQIYVSPYCNNANCKRTTGKYATGIARILAAIKKVSPSLETAVFLNEWDNPQIVAAIQPTAIFSYQTIFYFTSIADCKAQCGSFCGAGENSAYIVKDGKNFTDILTTLSNNKVSWLGQMQGASTLDSGNPPDFWTALKSYTSGTLLNNKIKISQQDLITDTVVESESVTTAPSPLNFLAFGDWGGGPLWYLNYTTIPQHQVAAGMSTVIKNKQSAFILALGDNFYPMGLCNFETLAPYNNTCANASNPLAGTEYDPRIQLTFEAVYQSPSLFPSSLPFFVLAGNHDALGNVSASIAYSSLSNRWRHEDYYYSVVYLTNAGPVGESVEILMVDSTLCYGIWSDPVHDAMCAAQLVWLEASLNASKANYLFVAAHYPIWSGCSHGNTQWAIDTLLPLLINSHATGYLSGHDHCQQHMVPDINDKENGGGLVFILTGTGDGCCYTESNIDGLPKDSLKFILSSGVNPSNATGGFASFDFIPSSSSPGSSSTLLVTYNDQDGKPLFVSEAIKPRNL